MQGEDYCWMKGSHMINDLKIAMEVAKRDNLNKILVENGYMTAEALTLMDEPLDNYFKVLVDGYR
jgi:hypothetical protein